MMRMHNASVAHAGGVRKKNNCMLGDVGLAATRGATLKKHTLWAQSKGVVVLNDATMMTLPGKQQ